MPVRIHLAPKTDLRHHTTRPHRPASHFDQLLHWVISNKTFCWPLVRSSHSFRSCRSFPQMIPLSRRTGLVSAALNNTTCLRESILSSYVVSRAMSSLCANSMPLLPFGMELTMPTLWTSLGISLAFLRARSNPLALVCGCCRHFLNAFCGQSRGSTALVHHHLPSNLPGIMMAGIRTYHVRWRELRDGPSWGMHRQSPFSKCFKLTRLSSCHGCVPGLRGVFPTDTAP